MRKEDTLCFGDKSISIKEMTVAEVRHWMMDILEVANTNEPEDKISFLLDKGFMENEISLSEIKRMTDASMSKLEQFTATELRTIISKCKDLNPDFFALRSRVIQVEFPTSSSDLK